MSKLVLKGLCYKFHQFNYQQNNFTLQFEIIGVMNSTAEKIFEEIKHISFDNIPSYLQFNRRIVRGYRVGYNFRSLLKSLFEWHNETVNAWTHLIGAIIIFFVIFSSNLFTQHYHSKHQLLNFRDILQSQQSNLTVNHFKITFVEENINNASRTQGLFTPFIKTLGIIEKQINIIIKLTEEDNLIYRNHIIFHLKQFTDVKEHIQNFIFQSFNQNGKLAVVNLQQLRQKFEDFHVRIHEIVANIINFVQKLAQNVNPIPKWPLLVFFFTASICLTFSFTFHLFHPHSEFLYKILRKLDFSGVILLIIGSSFPLFIYGASCVSHLANAYLCIMSILGIIAFCLLVSGYFDPHHRQKKKSLLFGLFGVSFLIPISHISMLEYWDQIKDPMGMSQFVARVLTLGAFYLIGLFIYTVQCPQRYAQGKFDYCGASHQIWHLSVLIALYITYQLHWDLYYQRRINPCLCES